ncbi:MAG: hypothetical protein DLM54_02070 [Acidimicrobiales bacterium]|nr:MAG: hypothetical protein DLM54_02070 [Acidimicrobiales bacterium]
MAELRRYGAAVDTVFDLLGDNENDLTAALAFTLSKSSVLTDLLLQLVKLETGRDVALRLETADESGRTDLEIDLGKRLVIVEAKRGAGLPTTRQLNKYVKRVLEIGSGALVTLSAAPSIYAELAVPSELSGVPVSHIPWADVLEAISTAYPSESRDARRWLAELGRYLRKVIYLSDPASSWAYCVSVSREKPGGGGSRTYKDFVVNENIYFHPYGVGSNWPLDPPTFMAFRWNGSVHQIRRVMSSEVIPTLQARWPDIPLTEETDLPHAVYKLGPPLPMQGPLPSGANYRAVRLRVLIDQLLTQPTLKDAYMQSKVLTGQQR